MPVGVVNGAGEEPRERGAGQLATVIREFETQQLHVDRRERAHLELRRHAQPLKGDRLGMHAKVREPPHIGGGVRRRRRAARRRAGRHRAGRRRVEP